MTPQPVGSLFKREPDFTFPFLLFYFDLLAENLIVVPGKVDINGPSIYFLSAPILHRSESTCILPGPTVNGMQLLHCYSVQAKTILD